MLGKKRKRDSNWISAEIWSLIDKRRDIKEKNVCKITETNFETYSLANREVRKNLRKH